MILKKRNFLVVTFFLVIFLFISNLIKAMKSCCYIEVDGTPREIKDADFIVIAPFNAQVKLLKSKLDETMILVLGKDNTDDIKFVCAFHVFNSLNLRTTVVPCLYFDILDEFKAILIG